MHVRDAEALVVKLLREEHVSPWPSNDVIEFYALELIDMTEHGRFTAR